MNKKNSKIKVFNGNGFNLILNDQSIFKIKFQSKIFWETIRGEMLIGSKK